MTLWVQESTRRLAQRQAGLVEINYNDASLDNAGEINWHAIGLARVEQQYYILAVPSTQEDTRMRRHPLIGHSTAVQTLSICSM